MDQRQIMYFVALYEEQSITKAARRLHVVQPAVSMQIRRIEVEYDVQLFDRTTRGVFPNQAAEAIYPQCLEILEKVEQVRSSLRSGSGKLGGALRVGVPPSIAHGILADVLVAFQEQYPDVQLVVSEGYSAHLVEWLLQGDLDFTVLGELDHDARLQSQPIATEELRVLIGIETTHNGNQITGRHLQGLKLILPSSRNLIRMLIDSEFERSGIELTAALELDSLAAVFATVQQPGWASILPASAIGIRHLSNGLRSLTLVDPVINRTLIAAFPTLRPPSAAAQKFIEALRYEIMRTSGQGMPT